MKITNLLGLLTASLVMSFSAYGQQMPAGNVVETTSCNLNDGVSMREVVEWGRANPRNPDSTNLVFFRQPIYASTNFTDNYDFRIATYFGTYDELIGQREARRSATGPRMRPTPLARDMFTCDQGSRIVTIVRNIPDGDAFTGDETLLESRLCQLDEGRSTAEAYNFVTVIAANFRAGGNNALMQVTSRVFGPIQNVSRGRAVLVTSVAETADSMSARLDLSREGLNVAAGLDGVMSCGFSEMWRTHAVYRPDN